jgi:hypothetical protein
VRGDGDAAKRRDAGHVDNRAAIFLVHQLEGLARAEKRAVQMDPEHGEPLLVGNVLGDVPMRLDAAARHALCKLGFSFAIDLVAPRGAGFGDAGVVDENVERSKVRSHF